MSVSDWRTEYPALVTALRDRLGSRTDCADIIDSYEDSMRSIWSFVARLLRDGGTRAVLARSIQLAARDEPLLQNVQVADRGVDFSELRDHVVKASCSAPEVLDALLLLGVMIFRTLSDLSGDAVTGPLLRHLEERK